LEKDFDVDEHAVRVAIEGQRSFNAIHFDSVFKVDIFIPKSDALSQQQLERRELRKLAPEEEQMIYVATAEDTILAKLRWYDSGGKISSSQWNDVLGIIGSPSAKLDLDYLREWSEKLALTGIMEQALTEAGDEDRRAAQ
jgi:hypothetical protein